jgi:hypothetical protein
MAPKYIYHWQFSDWRVVGKKGNKNNSASCLILVRCEDGPESHGDEKLDQRSQAQFSISFFLSYNERDSMQDCKHEDESTMYIPPCSTRYLSID